MTQIEQIKAEIERRIEQFKEERSKVHPTTPNSVDRLSLGARIAALEETLVFIQSLPAEQPSEGLEKAADYYLDNAPTAELMYGSYEGPDVHDAFVAGANWQKEQMMKSAVRGGYIKLNRYTKTNVLHGFSNVCDAIQQFKDNDRVRIIIIKEEEQ